MKRAAVSLIALAAVLLPARAAQANHVPPSVAPRTGFPDDAPLLRVGDVDFVANVPLVGQGVAGPLGERGAFTRDGRRYIVASSTPYGLHVVDVTDPLKPSVVSGYSAAFGCPTQNAELVAAREDYRALPGGPFGAVFSAALGTVGYENDLSVTPDGRIAILGMDAPDRCHDPVAGGLELVDLTDLSDPRTLHLTRDRGLAHSVTIDPEHPWLAYISGSDRGVNDFIEIVDFRSCLGGVATIEDCRPVVARAVMSPKHMPGIPAVQAEPSGDPVTDGCHDIRFRGDLIYCAALTDTVILDTSDVLDAAGNLTGTHLTSGPHACPIVDAVRAGDAKVTDCYGWTDEAFEERDAKSVRMRALGIVEHDRTKPATESVEISHQAEAIDGGRIMFVTDERGGGLGFGPAIDQCDPVVGRCLRHDDGTCPGGGIWFYDIRDDSHARLMTMPGGKPALFITENFVDSPVSCTVHYGQQVPGENLLVFAWYTAGTHVIRFDVDYTKSPAEISFEEVATYVPAAAWTIQAKPMGRNPANPDELIIYTADASRGLDVLVVNVPREEAAGSARRAAKAGGGSDVRGVTHASDLPATGVGDPASLALTLLVIAAAVARRMRRPAG